MFGAFISRVGSVSLVRAVLLHPVITLPGYWCACAVGLAWGILLGRGSMRRRPTGLVIVNRMPRWSFGRGGTTIGCVFFTRISDPSQPLLSHEDIHRRQWKRYGLCFPLLYLAAGRNPHENRFEQEAGLATGGYL